MLCLLFEQAQAFLPPHAPGIGNRDLMPAVHRVPQVPLRGHRLPGNVFYVKSQTLLSSGYWSSYQWVRLRVNNLVHINLGFELPDLPTPKFDAM